MKLTFHISLAVGRISRVLQSSLALSLLALSSYAAAPNLLTYQGRVVVDGVNFTGTGKFKFALVDAAGTTTYWSNDGTSSGGNAPIQAVTLGVDKGYYAVMLGDTTLANMTALSPSVLQAGDVRLRVWFNDGVHGFERLTPDQRLSSAAYAMVAASVQEGAITTASIADATSVGRSLLTQTTTSAVRGVIGLGNVSNTADADKPVSAAVQTALSGKVDTSQVGVPGGVAAQDLTETRTRQPRKALSKIAAMASGVAQLRVLTFGDSMSGLGGGSFPTQLFSQLEKAYGGIGSGESPVLNAAGAASVASGEDYSYWPTGTTPYVESGGSLTYRRGGGGALADQIKVYYIKSPGAGSFKLQTSTNNGSSWSDEVGYTNVSAQTGSVSLGIITISKPIDYYQLRVVGLTGRVYFLPAGTGQFRATTVKGVESLSIAKGGLGLGNANLSSIAVFTAWLADAAPDIGFFEMKESAATLPADIVTFKSRCLAGAPSMDWVYILSTPISSGDSDQVAQNNILRAQALQQDYGILDFYRFYGSYAVANSQGYMSDGLHRTATGNQVLVGYALEQLALSSGVGAGLSAQKIGSGQVSTSLFSVSVSGGSKPVDNDVNVIRIEPDNGGLDAKITSYNSLKFYNVSGSLVMRLGLRSDFTALPPFFMVGDNNLFIQGDAGGVISVRERPYGPYGGLAVSTVSAHGGDVSVKTAGRTFRIKEGANAAAGVVALSAGSAVVATSAVTNQSRIKLTPQSLGTITRPAAVGVTARIPGTSFTIMSSAANDTSLVYWEIMEPAQ